MTKDKALKLALEALDTIVDAIYVNSAQEADAVFKANDAITAIKEASAQPEQEPVSWMVYTQDGQSVYVTDNPTDIQEGQRALPLYTTPPQRPWVGLTGKDIIEMWPQTSTVGWDDIRLIEAKLKQKNGYNEEKNT